MALPFTILIYRLGVSEQALGGIPVGFGIDKLSCSGFTYTKPESQINTYLVELGKNQQSSVEETYCGWDRKPCIIRVCVGRVPIPQGQKSFLIYHP